MVLIQEGAPGAVVKGAEPPPVEITFLTAADANKEVSVRIPRRRIDEEPQLETKLQNQNGVTTGYVRLKRWDSAAERELLVSLEKLSKAGAQRITLDLRNNLGGLVPES